MRRAVKFDELNVFGSLGLEDAAVFGRRYLIL